MPAAVLRRGGLAGLAGTFDFPPGRAFLVSSHAVLELHGGAIRRALAFRGVTEIPVEDGEAAKSWDGLRRVTDAAIGAGIRRDDFVIGFGGGAVTDLAGFAAAILLRGVRWYAIPTTLLGMADAAIGGKTAIDHPSGKNLLGAFHPPAGVLLDPDLLETLPDRQLRSGLAEVFKAALVGDAEAARGMIGRLEDIARSRDLDRFLQAAVAVKEDLVARDPGDEGDRRFLNFGHTLGHALERWSGYERFTHGECICLGMAAALDLSARLAGLPQAEADGIGRELLEFAGREVARAAEPDAPALWDALGRDKKFSSAGRPAVLISAPGRPLIRDVAADAWREALRRVRGRIVL